MLTQPTGIVLAAGAGTRMGGPKALLATPDGTPWLAHAVSTLYLGGCGRVIAVLGAEAERARALLPPDADAVVADDWADGVSASLRAGLAAATGELAVVTLVDLPGLTPGTVERVLAAGDRGPTALRRAVYAGLPGHPVVIGRDHWAAIGDDLRGDAGAGDYLQRHGAELIECGDLWDGVDVDISPAAG